MSKRKSSNRARRAKKPGSGRGNGRIIRARDADDLDLGEDVGAIGYGRRHATADEAAEIDIAPPGGRGKAAASGQRQSAVHPRGRANTGAAHSRSRSAAKPAPSSHAQHESQARAPRSSSRAGAAAGAIGVLTCTAGPEEGLGLTLTEGVYGIGRGRDNHFVLKDIAASRQHVEIRVHNGQVTVYDLGSGNGTRVNGKRIQQAALTPGDRVEIGNSALTFSAMGQVPSGQHEVALVPPEPAPRPQDLWPETETLLSELKEFESRVAARPRTGHTGEASLLTRPGRPRPTRPQQPQQQQQQPVPARPQPPADLDPSATMAEIQAAIGSSSRSGSMGWLLMGALIIVVLLGGAATVVYVTVVRSSDVEQARVLATKGSLALAQGQFDGARKNIEESLRLDPKNEEAQASLDLLNRNEQSERSYRRAQEMLEEDEYRDARHALEGIKKGTPRFKDLPELERKIDQEEVAELAKKAKRALEANDLDKADKLVTRALDLDGDNERARAVQDSIIKAKARPLEAVKPDDREGATKDESWTAQDKTKKTDTKKTSKKKTSKKKTSKKKTSKKKPSRKSASSSLSDDDADDLFRQAVRAYKEDDLKKSRRLMNKVIKGTKPGTKYHLKASSFIDRRL